jgi:hypothetical protein
LQVKTITTALNNARAALTKWRAVKPGATRPPSAPGGRSGRQGRGLR